MSDASPEVPPEVQDILRRVAAGEMVSAPLARMDRVVQGPPVAPDMSRPRISEVKLLDQTGNVEGTAKGLAAAPPGTVVETVTP